jgi:hypothetical protein
MKLPRRQFLHLAAGAAALQELEPPANPGRFSSAAGKIPGPTALPAVFLAAHSETPFATRAVRRRRGVFHWRQRAARSRNRTQRVRATSTSGVWQKPK